MATLCEGLGPVVMVLSLLWKSIGMNSLNLCQWVHFSD